MCNLSKIIKKRLLASTSENSVLEFLKSNMSVSKINSLKGTFDAFESALKTKYLDFFFLHKPVHSNINDLTSQQK